LRGGQCPKARGGGGRGPYMASCSLGPAKLGDQRQEGRQGGAHRSTGEGGEGGWSVVPWSHGPAQVQGGEGGVAARPLRCRCALRRRVSLAPFTRVMSADTEGGRGGRGEWRGGVGGMAGGARALHRRPTTPAQLRTQTRRVLAARPIPPAVRRPVSECGGTASAWPAPQETWLPKTCHG